MEFLLTRQSRTRNLRDLLSKEEAERASRTTKKNLQEEAVPCGEIDQSTTGNESFTERSGAHAEDLRNPSFGASSEQFRTSTSLLNRELPPDSPPRNKSPERPRRTPRRGQYYSRVASTKERISSALPSTPQLGIFNSNHVLVNRERARRQLPPYRRSRDLDELARRHATAMAQRTMVYHSVRSIEELRAKLDKIHVAENVQSGDSITQMHQHVMSDRKVSFQNIVGKFEEFGMATAKGSDGKLYLCQLFRR
jgi:uncharacterized protein YkwD